MSHNHHFKMDSCIVDVKFLQNEDKLIFGKRILIAGITKTFEIVNKDIVFPYPSEKEFNEEEDFKALGHLELLKKQSELTKTLSQFTIILVPSKLKCDFIASFVHPSKKIGIIAKKETKTDEHCRCYTMFEKDCEK